MTSKPKSPGLNRTVASSNQVLRHLAEDVVRGKAVLSLDVVAEMTPEDTQLLFHELRVHQIELEMQNEELRQAQAALDNEKTRYFELYDLAPVGYCTVNEMGLVLQANLTAASLLGVTRSTLVRHLFTTFVFRDDQDIYYLLSRKLFKPGAQASACDLRMLKNDGTPFWIHLAVTTAQEQDGAPVLRIVLNDVTERKQLEDSLREQTRQLQAVSRRVLEVQEAERRRVAMELHDELGQSLTAIKINLQAQDRFKELAPGELNAENIHLVEAALQQVRHLAQALRPSILDDLGLLPALRSMVEQTTARSGVAVQFYVAAPPSRLAPEVETACFRIVQEALTNIMRHAHAQQVEIDLHLDGDALVLSVHDDGCGFDLAAMQKRAQAGGSIGVLGMQERATLIGGQLELQSTPGHGSTVRLRCPLRLRGEAA